MLRLIMFILILFSSPVNACNVCHSKNPKMINMHKELEYKNCFTCHGLEKKKTIDELKKQRTIDSRCVNCH